MAYLDITTADSMLKEFYTNDKVQNLIYKDNPFLAMVPKMKEFYGKNLRVPLIYGNPQGRSATFSRAQARSLSTYSRVEDFVLTRQKDYSVAVIDNEVLLATQSNAGAFLEAATLEIDGAINALTRSLAVACFRDGSGAIGRSAASATATKTITLVTPEDITNFEVGMELVFAADPLTSAIRAVGSSTNGVYVVSINRAAGTLTVNANLNDATDGAPNLVANDYIFVRGDRKENTTVTPYKLTGLAGWLPTTAPSASESFFGVDRSVDATRLGGIRFDGSALPIEEALISGASLVAREGGRPDHIFVSYGKYSELEKAMGSKVQIVDTKVTQDISFRGMILNGPKGFMKVIPDQNCEANKAYMLQLDTWKLYSLGEPVRVVDSDGLTMLRQSSSDSFEVRYVSMSQLGCNAPGFNAVVTLG